MLRPLRCLVQPTDWHTSPIHLSRDESHYALDVHRARPGDRVELFDGAGRVAEGVVCEANRGRVSVETQAPRAVDVPLPAFCLVQAVPKSQKMDLVVQKCTELGVGRIVPVLTAHTVVRFDARRAAQRLARWRAIAVNAARQSGRAWMPEVEPVCPLEQFLDGLKRPELFLFCDLGPGVRALPDVLADSKGSLCNEIGVIVGPEGDVSDAERDALRDAGAVSVDLGDTVLRTETAAIYAMSVLRYEFRQTRTKG